MAATQVDQQAQPRAEDGGDAPADPQPAAKRPRPLWLDPGRWSEHQVTRWIAPALIYLAARELGLLVLQWMAGRNSVGVTRALTAWDGQWFLAIGDVGYDRVPPSLVDAFGNRHPDTALAFFPGYPWLVRVVSELPGVSLVSGAFAVSVVSGLVCSYGLVRLGERLGGSWRCGLMLVTLFAAAPMSIVLSMAYSEALFCALAVWSLVGLVERRWLLAGLCCAAAGLVRPTAAALVLAVGVAALVAVIKKQDSWRPWLAGLLAPTGLVGYLSWVGWRTGRWDGWLALQQRGWDTQFDGGKATLKFSLDVLASARSVLEVSTVWLVLAALGLFLWGLRIRLPWPLLVYAAGVLFMDLGSNGLMNSKARLLLPAFVLLIPPAMALARRRPGTVVPILTGFVVFGSWFGAYMIASWPYAI